MAALSLTAPAQAAIPDWLGNLCQELMAHSSLQEEEAKIQPQHGDNKNDNFRMAVLNTENTSSRAASRLVDTMTISSSSISHLNLNLRRFNVRMMQALVNALERNSEIQVINLTSSLVFAHSCSIETLHVLANLLQHHPSLQIIHLSYNRLPNASSLGQTLSINTTLRELHLDHNQLTPVAAMSLAEGLARNPATQLQVLCLNSNRIGDVGGEALGRLLHTNKSLKKLQLAQNRLGPRSAAALCEALEHCNVTLTELCLDENPLLVVVPHDQHSSQFALSDEEQVKQQQQQRREWTVLWIQQLIRANQVGRYLLKYTNPTPPVAFWPHVLEGLEANPQYYFLQELPALTNNKNAEDVVTL